MAACDLIEVERWKQRIRRAGAGMVSDAFQSLFDAHKKDYSARKTAQAIQTRLRREVL